MLATVGCRVASSRAECASDTDCPSDQVCLAEDARCLPVDLVERLGVLGDDCGPGRPSCPEGSLCLSRACRAPASTPPPPPPCSPDAPIFGGVTELILEGADAIYLEWLPAASPSAEPIQYLVYWVKAPLVIDYGAPRAVVPDLRYLAAGLETGATYRFAVRAQSGPGPADCNERVLEGRPAPPPACVDYAEHVAPILRRCTGCHAGPGAPQHLALGSYADLIAGSVRADTLSSCAAGRSGLLAKLGPTPPRGARMPLGGPYLTEGQVELLRRFLTDGAKERCADPDPCADREAPTFAGLASAAAEDARTVRLAWPAAADGGTPPGGIRYEVYAGAPGASPAAEPARVVAGATETRLTVAPGTELCFRVHARDLAGNAEGNTEERCVQTPPADCALDHGRDVAPIFAARCVHCHGGASPPRFLDLTSYAGALAGGSLRSAVAPCDFGASLIQAKTAGRTCGGRMPLDGPPYLSLPELSVLEGWMREGARASCADPAPCTDDLPPTFAGLATAELVLDTEVELCWAEAVDDHSARGSLRYEVFEARTPGGQRFDRPASYAAAGQRCLRVPVAPGAQSCWVVRARDLAGNREANGVERCLTPPPACVDFAARVLHTFAARCVHCHSGTGAPRGIRWDSYANAVAKTDEVRPCAPGESAVVEATRSCSMPRDTTGERCAITACLTPAEQGLISEWIRTGARPDCAAPGSCP